MEQAVSNDWQKDKASRIERMRAGNLTERERRIIDVLKAHPEGIALLDISIASAVSYDHTAKCLNMFRHAGLVEHNGRNGIFGRWCLAGGLDAVESALKASYGVAGRKRQILEYVASFPRGITAAEVAEKFARDAQSVRKHLFTLKSMGLLVNTAAYFGGAKYARWCVPAVLKDAIAYADSLVKNPRRCKRSGRKEPRGCLMSDNPVVRIVQASEAAPIRPTGPVSVFQLGAM